MPELSRFGGIVIRMYFESVNRITCLTSMPIAKTNYHAAFDFPSEILSDRCAIHVGGDVR